MIEIELEDRTVMLNRAEIEAIEITEDRAAITFRSGRQIAFSVTDDMTAQLREALA